MRRRLDDVVAIYRAAFLDHYEADPARAAADRRAFISRHLDRPDLRAFVALDDDGKALLAFTYGYRGVAGQWWHDVVAGGLGAAAGREAVLDWLSDCLEVVELHVLPGWQGRGLGRALLRELLASATERTAALSALDDPALPARRLYASEGFLPLLTDFRFPGGDRPYAVLAKRLR
jgi:GNAT superfamily N-acetyltransferase